MKSMSNFDFDDFDFSDWYDGSADKKVKAAVTTAKAVHTVSKKTGLGLGKMSLFLAGGIAAAKAVDSVVNKNRNIPHESIDVDYSYDCKQDADKASGIKITADEAYSYKSVKKPEKTPEEKKKDNRRFWTIWGLWMGGAFLLIIIIGVFFS